MNNASPRAKNVLAQRLLDRLAKLEILAEAGYFRSGRYCLAVRVRNPAEAALLGMSLGGGWGEIGYDQHTGGQFVVFCDALVQA